MWIINQHVKESSDGVKGNSTDVFNILIEFANETDDVSIYFKLDIFKLSTFAASKFVSPSIEDREMNYDRRKTEFVFGHFTKFNFRKTDSSQNLV